MCGYLPQWTFSEVLRHTKCKIFYRLRKHCSAFIFSFCLPTVSDVSDVQWKDGENSCSDSIYITYTFFLFSKFNTAEK